MKEQEEQGCLKPMVIGIIIAAIFILMAFLFVPHHKPETYNPLEDVIMVEEPVLKLIIKAGIISLPKDPTIVSNQKKKAKNS